MARIPAGWKQVTIETLCDFSNGHGFRPPDWSDHGLPIIRIQNLNGSTDFNYFAGEPEQDWLVEPGTLLFAWAGTRGVSFGPTIWNGPLGVLNQHIFRVQPKNAVIADWLFLALEFVTWEIERRAHGFKSTLVHVRRADITSQVVMLPPIGEQKKIVQIVSTWDEAISKTEYLLAALFNRKKGFMQHLLTGQVRFLDFVKSKIKQKIKYSEIPAEWDYVCIEDVAHQVSLKNNNDDELPVLSCTKYDGLVDSLTYFGRQIFSEDTSTYKVVKREQFAYATNHIEEGSIGYQNLHERALISPMYTVFETNEKVDDGFLYKLLKTEFYRHIFEVNTSASIDRRGSLRWNVFSQIKIPLPTLNEQKAISEVIDTCDQEILLTKRKLEALQQQKKGLIQKLLTGQIRVKV
jgi:type I restriction enzyme S subunit